MWQCRQLLPQGGYRQVRPLQAQHHNPSPLLQVHRREQSADQENVRRASGECQDLSEGGEDLQSAEEVQEGRAGGDPGGAVGQLGGGGQWSQQNQASGGLPW